jgi:hypothetical protein
MRATTLTAILVASIAISAAACVTADGPVESEAAQAVEGDPVVACNADLDTDPLNCGACGTVCGSGLCYAGACADDRAGHLFVIGHAYRTSNPALDRVLGNAVFLTEKRPVQIVTWFGPTNAQTPADLVTGTNAAIARAGSVLKNTFAKTRAKYSSMVQTMLPTADVFLIYAQPQATDEYLQALADEWRQPLDDFTRRGGIVIVLDARGTNSGSVQLVSGLLSLTGRTALGTNGIAYLAAHDDALAARIPLTFAAPDAIGYAPTGATDVATTEAGEVVVAHRAIY